MSVFFNYVTHLIKEQVNLLLNELQVSVGGPPVLHLGRQLTDLILFLLGEALVLVPLLHKPLNHAHILTNLPILGLLILNQVEDTPLIVLSLPRQNLLLGQLLVLHDGQLVDGFSQLDGLNFELFLLQVHLADLVIQLLNLVVLRFQLQLSISDLLIKLPASVLLDSQCLDLGLQIVHPHLQLVLITH